MYCRGLYLRRKQAINSIKKKIIEAKKDKINAQGRENSFESKTSNPPATNKNEGGGTTLPEQHRKIKSQ